jgi:hypothetical protein
MAADLHIHVFEGITERHLALLFENSLGSKYFNPRARGERSTATYEAVANTPNIWIGEVSWLKAMLLQDGETTYVPAPVQTIAGLIDEELPTLDDKLIADILAALDLPNTTQYKLAKREAVAKFLLQHKGKRVFTVSW